MTTDTSWLVIDMGVLGQTAVFVLSVAHSIGQPWPLALFQLTVGLIDMTFALLFLVFLCQNVEMNDVFVS